MADKKKIIEKIQQLFNLAKNNPSEEEAATALKMARAKMMQYGLEEADVQTVTREESVIGDNVVVFHTANIPEWASYLAYIVSQYFEVESYLSRNRYRNPQIVFYGHKVNSEAAGYAFESLFNQVQTLAKKFKVTKDMYQTVGRNFGSFRGFSKCAKREYRTGLVSGLKDRLIEIKREEKVQSPKVTALAVRYRDLANQYLTDKDLKLKEAQNHKNQGTGTAAFVGAGINDSRNLSVSKGLN